MSRLPLARTYRPQSFAQVLGQDAPAKALGAAASGGNVASSYIFSGTRGIGKTTLARIFAKTLNCAEGPAGDCCDTCPACVEIREGRCLDVLEMDAATHTGIDDIRELREAAQYPPGRERYRVFILDEAHQLSSAAWNGLLKVLEEPPSWCVFLFCTTEPHKIPATIESRSLHFSFRSPSPALLRGHLQTLSESEKLSVDGEALDLLVKVADGSVRDGLSALDQVRALAGESIDAAAVREALGLVPGEAIDGYIAALGSGDAPAALGIVASLEEQGQDLRSFAAELLESVRKLALGAVLETADPGSNLEPRQLVWFGRILDQLEFRLRQGGSQRALLDLATIRMTKMAGLTPLEDLVGRLEGFEPGPRAPRPPVGRGPEARPPGAKKPQDPNLRRPEADPAGEAPVASAPVPLEPGIDLLDQLAGQVQELRPSLAAVLRRAKTAQLSPDGSLEIVFPADGNEFWWAKLGSDEGIETLKEAIERTGANRPPSVGIRKDGAVSPPESAPRRSRQEILDGARQDPVVRALFERFGAVVLDSKAHEG